MRKICGTCKYWDLDNKCFCHRFPPDNAGRFPRVDRDDWCGFWELEDKVIRNIVYKVTVHSDPIEGESMFFGIYATRQSAIDALVRNDYDPESIEQDGDITTMQSKDTDDMYPTAYVVAYEVLP